MTTKINPKTTDIETTASGFYRLPCDGTHDHTYHFYMYYTKREVVKMWKEQHNQKAGK